MIKRTQANKFKGRAKEVAYKAAHKPSASRKAASPKGAEKIKSSSNSKDIINLILKDHKPLKALIKLMKNSSKSVSERRKAVEMFGPLLMTHAKPEEQVLYVHMKQNEDLRQEGFEGDVEHSLADQLLEEVKRTQDEDLWSARVKVLAELVEHHIDEEEEKLLPDYRKGTDVHERVEHGTEFLAAKANMRDDGSEKNPSLKPAQMSFQQ